jgi:hypothetical protein
MTTTTKPLPMPIYTMEAMRIENGYGPHIEVLLDIVRGIVWKALDVDTFGDFSEMRDHYRGKSLEHLVVLDLATER